MQAAIEWCLASDSDDEAVSPAVSSAGCVAGPVSDHAGVGTLVDAGKGLVYARGHRVGPVPSEILAQRVLAPSMPFLADTGDDVNENSNADAPLVGHKRRFERLLGDR